MSAPRLHAVLVGLAAALSLSEARATDFTLAAPLPFAISGAAGSLLPVVAAELEPGPTCTSGSCDALGPTLYYRIQLETGTLHSATAAFVGYGIGGPVGYVPDEDPATRRPGGVTAALSAHYERGPSFFTAGVMVAGESSEVIFRSYDPATAEPSDLSGSFRVQATLVGAATQFAPIALVEVPEPDGGAVATAAALVLALRAHRARIRLRPSEAP